MIYEMIINEKDSYCTYCPRPLIPGDVRAYKVTLKTGQPLEGCSVSARAVKSDGTVVTDIGDVQSGCASYTLANNMYDTEGEMRLLITVVDYDGSALTAKEIVFSVAPASTDESIDGDDRVPALNSLMDRCTQLMDECEDLTEGYNGIISTYYNLFNPEDVTFPTVARAEITVSGLDADVYSLNFTPLDVFTSDGNALEITTVENDHCTVNASVITDGVMIISFSGYLDYEHCMLVKGTDLPEHFKPYGVSEHINDALLESVYNHIEYGSQSVTSPKEHERWENVIYLLPNRIYNIALGEHKEFRLPQVPSESYAQILVQATVSEENSVTWGTDHFFGGETPHILPGRYNFIWEHDNGIWYAGAILKTEGETA